MTAELPILMAQQGFLVGDITGNAAQEFDASIVCRVFGRGDQ